MSFRFDRALLGALCSVALASLVTSAQAQSARFESGTFGGSGNTLTVARVPVTDANGAVTYKDVTIAFSVSSSGTLTAGTPTITASPTLLTGNFIAGQYKNGSTLLTVSGPGVGPGGRTTWSILGSSSCTLNVGWTSGPIAGHPQQARLQTNKISYAGYSYGTSGAGGCFSAEFWSPNALVGASGAPNGLTLFSYTDGYGKTDHATPVASLSFTRCQTSSC